MQTRNRLTVYILVLLTALIVPVSAQESTSSSQQESQGETALQEWSPVPEGWEIKAYQAQHQSIDQLMELVDGFIRAPYRISVSKTYNTLTLMAPESIHQTVGSMIARFDQPAKNVEVQFYLLRARREPNGSPDEIPQDLRPVLQDLADVTQYQSYQVIAAPLARTRSGQSLRLSGGTISSYEIHVADVRAESDEKVYFYGLSIEVSEAPDRDEGRGPGRASIRLSVDLRNEEAVVLGTSQLATEDDTALIAIVLAKVLN